MRLKRARQAFDDPEYVFELKHDGFRAVAYIENGLCRLVSRNLKKLRFESLEQALGALPVKNAILDGEIVCLDRFGVSHFNSLLDRKQEPILCAFDLLWLNDTDLRSNELLVRKEKLHQLINASKCKRVLYAQHIEGGGKDFFAQICSRDLEGIVAKRKAGVYKDDGNGWLKIKNPGYSQAEGRHDLLTRSSGVSAAKP